MKDVQYLIKKLQGFEVFLNKQATLFFKEYSKDIEQLQRDQLLSNTSSKGNSMGDYAPSTIKSKLRRGTFQGVDVKFNDSGRMQGGLKVYIEGQKVLIDSPVDYFKYNVSDERQPIGITPQNTELLKQRFIEFLIPKMNIYFK